MCVCGWKDECTGVDILDVVMRAFFIIIIQHHDSLMP